MERQLDYRVQTPLWGEKYKVFNFQEKSTSSQTLLALRQTKRNEKPRHRDSRFPSAVLAILGQTGWWAWQEGVCWGRGKKPVQRAVRLLQSMLHHVLLRKEHKLQLKERDVSRSDLLA